MRSRERNPGDEVGSGVSSVSELRSRARGALQRSRNALGILKALYTLCARQNWVRWQRA
jgi:hypothetical protein